MRERLAGRRMGVKRKEKKELRVTGIKEEKLEEKELTDAKKGERRG